MASGSNNNNSNNTSNNSVQPITRIFFTPEQYLENKRRLQQHVEMLDRFNRRGLENYLQVEADLKRKVAEGEQAKQQIQYLQQLASMRAIAPPLAVNRVVPPQNTDPNPSRYQHPVSDALNIPDAVMASPQDRYNANPNSRDVSSGSQQPGTLHVQSPASYPPTTASRTMSQAAQSAPIRLPQQIPITNSNVNVLPPNQLVQQATGQTDSSRTVSYSRQQQAKVPAGADPSISRYQGPQLQPYQPWFIERPPVSVPVPVSGHEGSVSGSSQQSYYTTSSSSLAGALGETSRAVSNISVHDHPPPVSRTGTERNERTVAGGISTRTQPPAKSPPVNHNQSLYNNMQDDNIPVATAFSATSENQPRQSQENIGSVLGKHLEAVYSDFRAYFNAQGAVAAASASNRAGTATTTAAASSSQTTSTSGTRGNAPIARSFATSISSNGGSSRIRSSVPRSPGTSVHSAQKPHSNLDNSARYIQPASIAQQNVDTMASDAPDSHIPDVTESGGTLPFLEKEIVAGSSSAPNHVPSSHAPNSSPSYDANRCTIPPFDKNRPQELITPASANRSTLAKDVLRALNRLPEKRKASTPESSASDIDVDPPTKRPFFEPSPGDVPVIVPDIFAMPPTHPVAEDAGVSAKIEEASETAAGDAIALNTSSPPPSTSAVDNPAVVPLQVITSDAPTVPDTLPPQSAVESRASSEAAVEADTALQPFEDSSVPLFLPTPSPRSTPTPSRRGRRDQTIGATSSSSVQHGEQSKKPKFKTRVYVEVPILTPEQRRRYSRLATDERATDTVVDERVIHEAQELATVSASRLQKRPCLWNDCDHVANSANALRIHVREHAELIPEKGKIFPCWWGDCIRRFNKREALAQHLQNHVKKSIYCPYQGCDAHLSHPLELRSHVQGKHPSGGCLKPSVKPFEPPFFPLPPLGEMPAYMVVNLPVQPAPISQERKAKLGPWVAKNCFGNVNLGVPRLNARNQPQRRRADDGEPKLMGDWQDRYDFLDLRDTGNIPTFADLETSKAIEEVANGLVLLPDKAGPRGPLGEQTFTSRADRVRLLAGGKYIIKAENEEGDAEMPETEFVDMSSRFSQEQPQSYSRQSEPQESQAGAAPVAYQDFLGVGEPQHEPQPQPQSEIQLVALS